MRSIGHLKAQLQMHQFLSCQMFGGFVDLLVAGLSVKRLWMQLT